MSSNAPNQALEAQLKHFQQVLLRNPKDIDAQINCANYCVELKRYEEAAGYFRRVVRALKTNVLARDALCYALQALGNEWHAKAQFNQAEACFEEALQHQPANAIYWFNLGNAQRELGKLNAALNSFKQSIQFNPNDADAHNNLGNIQRELGQLDLAIISYGSALQLQPDLHHALAHLVHQKQHICDWQNINQQINQLRDWVMTKPSAKISPFAFISLHGTTAAEQKQCATNWATSFYSQLIQQHAAFDFSHLEVFSQKIKIGYISADFRLHPLAFLITELIENSDKSQFETIAYSYGTDDQSPERKRLQNAFDNFNDIRQLTDIQAAQKIYEDGVAILVDLTGFTQNSRTGIVALKPAPISVNWLGFAGTMGFAGAMGYKNGGEVHGKPLFDYLLADEIIAPNADDFSEKLLYLPCYQPNNSQRDNNQQSGAKPTQKSDHNLPENSFVFCCFNQSFKITPEVFAVWMHILRQTTDSVLWLLDCNSWVSTNLRKEATKAGIDAARLIFAPRVPITEHLERHSHADLFLDTSPYNAHTSASDALWVGLPLLTCTGETFASRVATSLLQRMDLTDLITQNWQEYAQKAIFLAKNSADLKDLTLKIASKIHTTALFNPDEFAQNLARQYQKIWQKYQTQTIDH